MERKPDGLEDTLASETKITRDDATTSPDRASGVAVVLSDRYRPGDVIGRGGMGEVMSANDTQIGRTVAIKQLRGEVSEGAIARFLREAKIQGRLDHPAIVPVHELCIDSRGRPYFVMKQLTGRTLDSVLETDDPELRARFNRQTLLRAFIDVCLAVEFAHTRGVIHRDLKPSNIMLGDFGEVYVLDWGIARVLGETSEPASLVDIELPDASTVAGSILGTPGYMSPEQLRGEPDLDGRTDVFALGCILFEILTRSPLYPRGRSGMFDALEGTDARPTRRADDVAPELDAPCVEATMTEREQRTRTARALAEQVQRHLDGDRDLALRKTLAEAEVTRARAALERDDVAGRKEAIRAAARALALDPTAKDPAQLVGSLMMQPPTEIPPEVEHEITSSERVLISQQLRAANVAMLGYFGLFPLSWAVGIDQPWFLSTGPLLLALIFASALLSFRAVRLQRKHAHYFAAGFILHCALVGVIAHALSPFLIAPALMSTLVMIFASHRRFGNVGHLIGGGLLAVLLPLGLELTGVIRQTVTFTGSTLVIDPTGTPINEDLAMIAMIIFIVTTIIAATLLSRSQAIERDNLQKRLQLQAWQLRQLVPQ